MPRQSVSQEIDILNIRLPDDIIHWIDSMVQAGVYSSRSEVIRDLIREFINEV